MKTDQAHFIAVGSEPNRIIALSRYRARNVPCSSSLRGSLRKNGCVILTRKVAGYMKFRKDINGLRAVAVVLVLLFHGGVAAFPSGFIGVDVFFVISGFLISSIVRADLVAGNFSLAGFYIRRLWRIQAALIVMIAATLLIAIVFYLPSDLDAYFRSATQTTAFASNYYFAKATTAYEATGSQTLLLLHTWSLSVEWQWYLIMPMLMWLLYRYASPRWSALLLIAVALALAAVALRAPVLHGNAAYFWFSTRIFEFLLGAALALSIEGRSKLNSNPLLNVIGLLALLTILIIATRPGVIIDYPNGYSLALCAASLIVLWVGANERSWVSGLLSLAPMVFIGDISYSLYLWHWPIFATWRYLKLPNGVVFWVIGYGLTLLLGFLSYRYIEQPCRRLRLSLGKSVLLLVALPLLIMSAAYGIAHKYSFFPGRFGPELAYVEGTLHQFESPLRKHCLQGRSVNGPHVDMADMETCVIGQKDSSVKGLMIGDSHSNQYWNFVDLLSRAAGTSIISLATPSCLALPDITLYGWSTINYQQYRVCEGRASDYYDIIQSHKFKYVILGENWVYYAFPAIVNNVGDAQSQELGKQRLEVSLRKAMDIITSTGATPIVIKSAATMPEDFQECFYQHFKLRRKSSEVPCALSSQKSGTEIWYDHMFERLKASYPSLVLIDPRNVQCTLGNCMTTYEGVPIYRDTGHLSDYGAYQLGELYLQNLPNPFSITL
jgi:peptidoglycan/LPS O-acetylase OafA/YrhL